MFRGDEGMRFAVKEMREKAGMTQEELSAKSGVSLKTISALEANSTSICNSKDITYIAYALGISVKNLFFEDKV